MKVIFTSSRKTSPSFIFYAQSLSLMQDAEIIIDHDPNAVDYSQYDVALFMGSDECSQAAKRQNKNILTGIIDPRASRYSRKSATIDFIVANDIESQDYFSQFSDAVAVYHTYPIVPQKENCPIAKNTLVLGYHGNKIHMEAMSPRITNAIDKLSKEISLELWAMYNIKELGKWKHPFNFPVRHIEYSQENYAKYIAHADIGLVPQLMPVSKNGLLRYIFGSLTKKYNESTYDFILRFKETTNRGRHLVFAQYGIPVVSDMTPSACNFIETGNNSFVAYHSAGWYRALATLAGSRELRAQMGARLKEKYMNTASPDVQNRKFVGFLNSLRQI